MQMGAQFWHESSSVGALHQPRCEVVKIQELKRNRLPLPVVKACCVLEADTDAPRRWNLQVGDTIEIRFAQDSPTAS